MIVRRGKLGVDAVLKVHPAVTDHEHGMSHDPVGNKESPGSDIGSGSPCMSYILSRTEYLVRREVDYPNPDQLYLRRQGAGQTRWRDWR